MQMSVIIPVRNDSRRLTNCLASLKQDAITTSGDFVNVIVADNGSTDDSPHVAAAAGARVISLPGLKVSAMRNAAAREATGELLAFIDADHLLLPGWTAAAFDDLKDSNVGAAGALCLPPPNGTWVQEVYGALRGRTAGLGETAWLGSGNMVVRRETFDRVGGFDAALEACEDVDLCRRMRAAGFRIIGDERLRNIHLGDPSTLAALFRAERWRGRDNLRVSLRGSVTMRDVPSIAIPIVTLAAYLTAIAGLLFWILGNPAGAWWLAAPLALVMALVALRTARILSNMVSRSPLSLARAFALAFVYDAARAVALISRAPYHRR